MCCCPAAISKEKAKADMADLLHVVGRWKIRKTHNNNHHLFRRKSTSYTYLHAYAYAIKQVWLVCLEIAALSAATSRF